MGLPNKINNVHVTSRATIRNKKVAMFSLCYVADENIYDIPNFRVAPKTGEELEVHYVMLNIIKTAVGIIAKSNINKDNINLYFHLDDPTIFYEWNNEYKKEGKFQSTTKDKCSWLEIINLASANNIVLYFEESSFLNGLSS